MLRSEAWARERGLLGGRHDRRSGSPVSSDIRRFLPPAVSPDPPDHASRPWHWPRGPAGERSHPDAGVFLATGRAFVAPLRDAARMLTGPPTQDEMESRK